MPSERIAKIVGEENLKQAVTEMFHVMVNLRASTKDWENVYGSIAKNKKKLWEDRADNLINDLESVVFVHNVNDKRGKGEQTKIEII